MKTSLIICVALSFTFLSAISQNNQNDVKQEPAKEKTVKFDLAGQVSVAKDVSTNVFLTFGGPSIKFGKGKTALNIGMFPSLRYNYDYNEKVDKTPLTPILGTGAQLSYKHVTVGCLFFLVKNMWYAAPAIGYKFK